MSKYIIKNCPAYNEKGCLYSAAIFPDESMQNRYITFAVPCADCTDCVIKQIVEKCKEEIKVYRNTLLPDDGTNTLHFGRQSFAYDILQLLDIQEIE